MRNLVIDTIIKQRGAGLYECGLIYIDYARGRQGVPKLLPEGKYEYEEDIPVDEFETIIRQLTDDELLFVLDQQACQHYR